MKQRLNITIDENVLSKARHYAEKHEASLSALIEDYLQKLPGTPSKNIIDLVESLPQAKLSLPGQLKEGYFESQKKKYGF